MNANANASRPIAAAGTGAAARNGRRPNLLLIQTDQQKATSLDLYNRQVNAVPTESLRQLAEVGTTFNTAYCPYPLCVPSRIAMMTGQWPSQSGYIGNHPFLETTAARGDRVPDSLFHAAKRAGCRTMLVGKDHCFGLMHKHGPLQKELFDRRYFACHTGQSPETQRDQPFIQPFIDSQPQLNTLWGAAVAPWPWTGEQSVSARLSQVACEYLKDWSNVDRSSGQPFAMWLSFPDPHEVYQAPADCYRALGGQVDLYPNDIMPDDGRRAEYIRFMRWYFNAQAGGRFSPPPEDIRRHLVQVYLAMCLNVDRRLVRVFQALRDLGEWENTLIIYCSDHGDMTGELGLLQKFNCGYDGCCRVPLLIAYPGQFSGPRHCAEPVNLLDLPATVCELLGWPMLAGDQGRSLSPMLAGDADPGRAPYTIVESGLPGAVDRRLTCRDIANFPEHQWDRQPVERWCYDPPHRFGGRMYVIRSARYKLIVRQADRPEFYDLQADPWEMHNRATDPSMPQQITQHYQWLAEHLCGAGSMRPGTSIAPTDEWYVAGGDKTWAQSLPDPPAAT